MHTLELLMKRTFPTTLKINLLSSAHPSHTGMKSYMLQNHHIFGYFDFSVLTRALGTPEYVSQIAEHKKIPLVLLY